MTLTMADFVETIRAMKGLNKAKVKVYTIDEVLQEARDDYTVKLGADL